MRRTFNFQHPTFGRKAVVDNYGCERSVYYWWWFALTLSDEYCEFCERMAAGLDAGDEENEQSMKAVYTDFGDVRYDSSFVSSYSAFKKWWTAKTGDKHSDGTDITRGAKLFAEAVGEEDKKVRLLAVGDERAAVVNDIETIVLAIPENAKRQYVDKAVATLIDKSFVRQAKGKKAKAVAASTAKYQLVTYPVLESIKQSLTAYSLFKAAQADGVKLSNLELAKQAKIFYKQKVDYISKADAQRGRQNLVTRKLREARQIVANVAVGKFPK